RSTRAPDGTRTARPTPLRKPAPRYLFGGRAPTRAEARNRLPAASTARASLRAEQSTGGECPTAPVRPARASPAAAHVPAFARAAAPAPACCFVPTGGASGNVR